MITPLHANDSHIDELVQVAIEIWHEHYDMIIGVDQVDYMLAKFQSKKAIVDQMRDGYQYFLIFRANLLVGYFSMKSMPKFLFLSKFYVKKSERGFGYGRSVIDFLCVQAKSLGQPNIQLTVNKNNTSSLAAYAKLGFHNVGSVVSDIGQGYVMDDFILELPITVPQLHTN